MISKITKTHLFVILIFVCVGIFFYHSSIYNFKTFIFVFINFLILIILKLNKKIFIIYSIFLFSVYSLEILIYFQSNSNSLLNKKILIAQEKNIQFDKRSLYEFIYDEKKIGKDIFPVLFPKEFLENPLQVDGKQVIPLSSIKNALTVYCNESGFYSSYISDKYGFNNYEENWKKLINSKNITLVGDSYVHGACVNQNSTISSFLNKKNKDYNFLNLGMGGNGPLTNYAVLREYGEIIKPKKVFYFFFEGNDYEDLKKELKSKLFIKYLDIEFSQNLIDDNVKINLAIKDYYKKYFSLYEPINFIGEIIRLKKIRGHLNLLKKKFDIKNRNLMQLKNQSRNILKSTKEMKIDKRNEEDLFIILSNTKSIVESWGGELILFILPDYGFYYEKKAGQPLMRKKYSEIFKISEKIGVKIIDLYKFLENNEDVISYFPFELPGHYNEIGYEFIADIINNVLKNN